MGIWERLESVIRSQINSEDVFGRRKPNTTAYKDPDLSAAYEELDDFLKGPGSKKDGSFGPKEDAKKSDIPIEVRNAFAELGLSTNASAEDCKEAYKKLLKKHHPDRHVKHEGNMKKATDKSARVNTAYECLKKWFKI